MATKAKLPVLTGQLVDAPPRREKALAVPEFAQRMGRGRPPGAKNKVAKEAKQLLDECFHKIGGLNEFAKWARANQGDFYRLWSRTLTVAAKTADDSKEKPAIYINISARDAQL